jgi:hypothetical protein
MKRYVRVRVDVHVYTLSLNMPCKLFVALKNNALGKIM